MTISAARSLGPGRPGTTTLKVFFATGRPALVVRPRADEVAAVRYAVARYGVPCAGGHSGHGHGTNTGG